jgi:hypothetical protein
MVNKCIECHKIIDSTRIYCKNCEKKIKDRIERKKNQYEKLKNADFFEKQRLKK